MVRPFAAVEVAVPGMLRAARFSPPPFVEVPVVARFNTPAMVVEPVLETVKTVVVAEGDEEAMTKRVGV